MTQYVIQIQTSDGWLAKCFEVTEKHPIPTNIPFGRVQIMMTNAASFEGITDTYNQYTHSLSFTKNGTNIECTGAVEDSWPID